MAPKLIRKATRIFALHLTRIACQAVIAGIGLALTLGAAQQYHIDEISAIL